jgi:hypothetical protein
MGQTCFFAISCCKFYFASRFAAGGRSGLPVGRSSWWCCGRLFSSTSSWRWFPQPWRPNACGTETALSAMAAGSTRACRWYGTQAVSVPRLSDHHPGLDLLPASSSVVQPHHDGEHDEDGTEDGEHVIKTASGVWRGEQIDRRHGRSLSRRCGTTSTQNGHCLCGQEIATLSIARHISSVEPSPHRT